jgi:hypothetical protein
MEFNSDLHQKVSYQGHDDKMKKSKLYIVVKSEYPNLYTTMKSSDRIVIHIINKFNQIIHNSDQEIRDLFTVTKEDIKFEGNLVQPN